MTRIKLTSGLFGLTLAFVAGCAGSTTEKLSVDSAALLGDFADSISAEEHAEIAFI